MNKLYHLEITTRALGDQFSPSALDEVIQANLGQDHILRGQIGHPEFHFDANAFDESKAYMEKNRACILPALQGGDGSSARSAFGRLIHAAQDLYAHSNYVDLWLKRSGDGSWPPPAQIDPLDEAILSSPALRSGKIYYPWEALAYIPVIRKLVIPLLPRDSHTSMNLDTPDRGPGFPYAVEAAVKCTLVEYQITTRAKDPGLLSTLTGL
jgi:hypothetical protein